jgi:xanthine dehydrogenase YagR molybdenum-binding subunit
MMCAGADSGKLRGICHLAINVTGLTATILSSARPQPLRLCQNITTSNRGRRGNMTLPTFMRSPWDPETLA